MKRHELRRALRAAAETRTPTPSPELWETVRRRLGVADSQVDLRHRPAGHAPPDGRRLVAWLAAAALALTALVTTTREPAPSHELELGTAAPIPSGPTDQPPATTPTPRIDAPPPEPSEHPTLERPSALPSVAPAPDPTPQTTAPRSPTATAAPEEPSVGYARPAEGHTMELWARKENAEVSLYWSAFDRDTFDSYAVLRSWYPHSPTWPADDETEIIRRLRHDEGHGMTDEGPWAGQPVYRVVALRADGSEAGRTRAVVAEEPADDAEGGGGDVRRRIRPGEAVDVASGRGQDKG